MLTWGMEGPVGGGGGQHQYVVRFPDKTGCEIISHLIISREDVISKLNFSNRCGSNCGHSYTESHNPLFTEWRVENAILT